MKKETEYRRGAEDTMQAYVAFGKKQEAAIQHASEQIGTVSATVSQIQNDVNGIIDYAIDSEKRGKLGLSAQRSITDLEKTDADYLVAALMQLAKEEGGNLTTLQQKYMSSVQRCLGITAPQPGIVLEGIESIDDVQAQKIILQTVLEFWRLGDKPQDFNEARESFLDCFQLNGKANREVAADVESMFQFLGADGVASRYAPAAQSSDNDETVCAGQEYTVDDDVRIIKGQRKIYQDAVVHMNANILCEGELCFKNCEIHYHEFGGEEEIKIGQTGSLSMYRCTVVCHGCGERAFIDSEDAQESVSFEKCQFNDCAYFVKGGTVVFEGCRMNTPSHLFVDCSDGTVKFSNCEMIVADLTNNATDVSYPVAIKGRECILWGCSIKRNDPHKDGTCLARIIDANSLRVERCMIAKLSERFSRCSEAASIVASKVVATCYELSDSLFDFDGSISLSSFNGSLRDCQFINCNHIITIVPVSNSNCTVSNCQFVGGTGWLIVNNRGNLEIESCNFDSWKTDEDLDYEFAVAFGIFYTREPMILLWNDASLVVHNCSFERIYAVGAPIFKCDLFDPENMSDIPIHIRSCSFVNCTTMRGEKVMSFYALNCEAPNDPHKKIPCFDKNCRVIKTDNHNSYSTTMKESDDAFPTTMFLQGEVGARLSNCNV